jgi:putative addiction module killer protein
MPNELEVRVYARSDGSEPFTQWLRGLRDGPTRNRIRQRIARVRLGNFGDTRSVGEGVQELRIPFGPGYRVYFGREGDLQDPAEAAGYLNACLEDGDPEVFLLALRDVARARGGVAKLAEVTELNREHLYRMLSENGNPELRSLETLLDALGFRLAVTLKEAS